MTPELLRLAGEAMFGPMWQAPLSRELAMTARHVSRMMNPNAKDRPTERLRPILIKMLREKAAEVSAALHKLETTDVDGFPLVPGFDARKQK